MRVDSVLSGDLDRNAIRVGHIVNEESSSDDSGGQFIWQRGSEGIFFLAPAFRSYAIPDLYVPNNGPAGILTKDLDRWSIELPRAEPALGSLLFSSPVRRSQVVDAMQAELIVEGTVELKSPGLVLDWSYFEVNLTDVAAVWTPLVGALGEGEGQRSPIGTSMKVVLSAEDASLLDVGEPARLILQQTVFPEPLGPAWLLVDGADGIIDPSVPGAQTATKFDALRAERDAHVLANRETALAILRPIAESAGRIPLATDVERQKSVDFGPLYRTSLTIEQEAITITFDRWFFAVLDGAGRVLISDQDGNLLLEGAVEGPDSIMREQTDQSFAFVDEDGRVVATVSQDELAAAASKAAADYAAGQP